MYLFSLLLEGVPGFVDSLVFSREQLVTAKAFWTLVWVTFGIKNFKGHYLCVVLLSPIMLYLVLLLV